MEKEKYSYGYAQEKYKPFKQKEEKYNLKLIKGNYFHSIVLRCYMYSQFQPHYFTMAIIAMTMEIIEVTVANKPNKQL